MKKNGFSAHTLPSPAESPASHMRREYKDTAISDSKSHSMSAKRRANHRERRDSELARAATPETLNKRRMLVIAELHQRDKLTAEQKAAADEIARVYAALTIEVAPCVSRLDGLSGRSSRVGAPDGVWKPSLTRAYAEAYVPWRDCAGRVSLVGRGATTLADLVLWVAVDNVGLRQVAAHLRLDQRTVLARLREGLHLYAEFRGWVDEPGSAQPRLPSNLAA